MTSKELRGRNVVGAGGRTIGVVHEIDVELTTWRVKDIIVRVEADAVADLGVRKPIWKSAHMIIHPDDVQGASDNLVLKIKLEDLAQRVAAARPSDEGVEPYEGGPSGEP